MYSVNVYKEEIRPSGRIMEKHHDYQWFRSLFAMRDYLENFVKFWKPKGFKVRVAYIKK